MGTDLFIDFGKYEVVRLYEYPKTPVALEWLIDWVLQSSAR